MDQRASPALSNCLPDVLHAADAQSMQGLLHIGWWVQEERVSVCSSRTQMLVSLTVPERRPCLQHGSEEHRLLQVLAEHLLVQEVN